MVFVAISATCSQLLVRRKLTFVVFIPRLFLLFDHIPVFFVNTGDRYKCSVREDFDLCASCESKEIQPHPMIKIYTPEQAPAAILIALREDRGGGGSGTWGWGRGGGGGGGGRGGHRHHHHLHHPPPHHHHHHGHHGPGPPPPGPHPGPPPPGPHPHPHGQTPTNPPFPMPGPTPCPPGLGFVHPLASGNPFPFGHPAFVPFRDPYGVGVGSGLGGVNDWYGSGPFNWRRMMRDRKWGCGVGPGGMGVGASGCPWTNSSNPSNGDGWKDKDTNTATASAAEKAPEDAKQEQGTNLNRVEHAEYASVNMSNVASVVTAQYGANGNRVEVTDVCRSFLTPHGILRFDVTNATMGGDPCPGIPKTLTLQVTELPPRRARENLADPVISAVADVISEVSAFAQAFAGRRPSNPTGAGNSNGNGNGNGNHVYQERTVVDDNDVVDQQLLEEAVRQSLESSAATATASATASASASASAFAEDSSMPANYDPDYVEPWRQSFSPEEQRILARQQQLPPYASHMAYTYGSSGMGMGGGVQSYSHPSQAYTKLMSRFVKDVTFPDGTQVQPGSVFLKTWRIRNDGVYAWPDQVALVHTLAYTIHISSRTLSNAPSNTHP